MSERYWYDFEDEDGSKIVDFEKDKEYPLETVGDFQKIEDLLNSQNKRIYELEKENEELKEDLKKQFVPFARANEEGITKVDTDTFIEILQENEQLKQYNEKLGKKYGEMLMEYNGLGCEYTEIKEENKQLKQDLNKEVKFVAKQESESTILVDFDEFVQLCKDSNDLKEKEERIKELEEAIDKLINNESYWEKKAKEQIQTQNKEINACYDTLTTITELCDAVLKHDFKGNLSIKDACKIAIELDNKDVMYLHEVFTAIRDNDLETLARKWSN